jgi:tubulin--tyrosine ligase
LSDRETHLTNDAVQKHSKEYGKFEDGNKLDLEEWQATILEDYPEAPTDVVKRIIFPEIKRLSKLSIEAAAETLSLSNVQRSFELYGYDYMIDESYQPVLIEVNTNPCLEFACPLLTGLITELIENTIRVAVDPEYPPPSIGFRTKACEDAIEALESSPIKFDLFYP